MRLLYSLLKVTCEKKKKTPWNWGVSGVRSSTRKRGEKDDKIDDLLAKSRQYCLCFGDFIDEFFEKSLHYLNIS